MLVSALFVATAVSSSAISPSLISEVTQVVPGRSFLVGVKMKIPAGWHFYWRNPGDSGTATQVSWKVPIGTFVTPLRWPGPSRIVSDGILSFGYEKDTALMALMTPSRDFRRGDKFTISAKVSWLECKETCIPQSVNLDLTLPVTSSAKASTQKGWLQLLNSTVPSTNPIPTAGQIEEDNFMMQFKPPIGINKRLQGAYFYPIDQEVVDNTADQKYAFSEGWVKLTAKIFDNNKLPKAVRGVLELTWTANHRSYFEVSVPVNKK